MLPAGKMAGLAPPPLEGGVGPLGVVVALATEWWPGGRVGEAALAAGLLLPMSETISDINQMSMRVPKATHTDTTYRSTEGSHSDSIRVLITQIWHRPGSHPSSGVPEARCACSELGVALVVAPGREGCDIPPDERRRT